MKTLRKALQLFNKKFAVRGRHRLANTLGGYISPKQNIELMDIDGFLVEIDHELETCRYIYYNVYEESFVNFLRNILKEGDVFIDGGANIGYITAVASHLVGTNGKVFSFEPSQTCYNKIVGNNTPLKSNIQLNFAAISDKNGRALFSDTPGVITHGYSHLSEVSTSKNSEEYEVETFTIDKIIETSQEQKIRCLKLDIEGAELMALQGAKHSLAKGMIDYILVETTSRESNRALNESIFKILQNANFKPFLASNNGQLLPFDKTWKDNFRYDIIWKLAA